MRHKLENIKWQLLRCMALLSLALSLAACSSDSDESQMPDDNAPTPQIIVMYSPGGLGDQGYNDCILSGIQQFKKDHYGKQDMYQYSPSSIEDAQTLLTNWLSLPESNIPALFIVGSNDYESMLGEALGKHPLTSNKRMLFFESDNPESLPVTTFRLSMYGASYLAGVTAAAYVEEQRISGCQKDALILLAHAGDNTIATAGHGFAAGFHECSSATAFTEYLAKDWTGYVSASLAYQRMSEWSKSYNFVFPVAGGSNQGIYRYTREHSDAPLTAGMDVDQSGFSNNITGCVIKHIDKLLYDYMEEWLNTGELPPSAVYGLESGYTDWLLSPNYQRYQPIVEAARSEAIIKENASYDK